jgi:hypothetical protein
MVYDNHSSLMKPLGNWQKFFVGVPRSISAWSKAVGIAALIVSTSPAKAIILYGTGDPNQNTAAPTGALANSGWELQGSWGIVQGTPVGPHHFITAFHVGGNVGDVFTFQGRSYVAIAEHADALSDLHLWEVAGTFPVWAQLYDGVTETGLDLMVYGRGVRRGAEVRVNNVLKGWQWGEWDGALRWGRNKVASLMADPSRPAADQPQLMVVAFNSNATADEAHLGYGDSGGGVFIQENGAWRLAGINYSVDGPYNTSNSGAGFEAAIFDEGGLYQGGGPWTLVADRSTSQAGNFYATRIKARLSWIQSVLTAPTTAVLLQASTPDGTYAPVLNATIDVARKTISVSASGSAAFYQISGLGAVKVTSTELSRGTLVLRYE